jgi:hypothetical protein
MSSYLQRHSARWNFAKHHLQRLPFRYHLATSDHLPCFVQHAVATAAVAQIDSDGPSRSGRFVPGRFISDYFFSLLRFYQRLQLLLSVFHVSLPGVL